MKFTELTALTNDELNAKEESFRKEIFELRSELSTTRALENPERIKIAKKDIARIKTLRTQRENKENGDGNDSN